jgi:hypothetical protein
MRNLADLSFLRLIPWLALGFFLCRPAWTQDLAPRAYLITPIRSNAFTLSYGLFDGNMNLDGSVPVTDATVRLSTPVVSYVRSMGVFGRSANILAALPYGFGNFRGSVFGNQTDTYRSGLLPPQVRFSMNLRGGPAMDVREFVKWKQKLLIGTSIKVLPPLGQYDGTKLINLGSNRWSFKPEVGLSRRWGHWLLDTYGGAWFYTANPRFFSENQFSSGINHQTQSPMGSFEGHFSYDVRPRLWTSLDANFWFGGASAINGKSNPLTSNRNSRVGGTVSVPVTKRQSLKFSYSDGAYIHYGGNYKNISVGWQYSWITKR